jgi:predicted  nucleic acid-binding Zn-ribbon protein
MSGEGFLTKRLQDLRRWWTGGVHDEHERQLMQLYWNRAELKKALAAAQEENDALADKAKNHEGAVRRAEEQVALLQAHLGNPTVGPHALTYFQLRAVWKMASDRLARFSGNLKREQEERERRRHQSEWQARRAAQLAELETQLADAQAAAEVLELQILPLERQLDRLGALWHYFKRREIGRQIAALRAEWEVAATQVTDLSDERVELVSSPLPEFPGMSLEGRRIVNTALIAFTEFLVLSLPHRALAAIAKQAMTLQVYDAFCGTAPEYTRVMELTKAALAAYADLDRNLAGLRAPTERIRGRALYRSTEDTVPLPESIGDVTWEESLPAGTLSSKHNRLNVLTDDYWSLGQHLM